MAPSLTSTLSLLSWCVFMIPISGHTLMQHPIPFASQLGGDGRGINDNGPMKSDGSNWPCNGEKDFDPKGVMNIWERGSTQYLQAMGGASHGGGSCQISITLDLKPTVYSEWRVIHSIHGGCPIRNLTEVNYGNSETTLLPSIYNFTIPDWVPVGQAVMAWTWYGRWSVPEMFMNCAPIMVLGGPTSKDVFDETLREKFNTAPLMFEANNGNGCWTANKGSCIEFPEPGGSLEVNPECPFDPEMMFTGTCGPSHRLAMMYSSGMPNEHRMLAGFVVAVSVLLLISVVKVFRDRRGLGEIQGYKKVVHA
ncbi:uncharacterized protein L3040_005878 [Drepanopeziza brunnea f. sp. 'multigermtubi']|uniref:Endoglucanase n=1 Tax=Marssonina brunnea f. sp. multigermtubi (strain MB_m1) TaxID=1072389 RepID=K1X758_MARBU|nr:uncharacterized protein MBM_00055 [Drepanopeziza brunnea f. sp. 'multigermtubi' MB_m1]EKD20942.1 hypothetical protein MBM_00055 [Drepanopeziza brunnea f. sp. 'multigermtubi' MB_m1]KAJ5041333.1 hypothetical protein L3040_005878 [Drepanopeziza brunnea f. sp. 'multigermtubi']